MYIDIIVMKKNPQFFYVKNINIYSILYLILFNFKEPEPDRSRPFLAAPAPGFFFGPAPAPGFFWGPAPAPVFFINRLRLRLQGVKNNRLLPAPAPQPW